MPWWNSCEGDVEWLWASADSGHGLQGKLSKWYEHIQGASLPFWLTRVLALLAVARTSHAVTEIEHDKLLRGCFWS